MCLELPRVSISPGGSSGSSQRSQRPLAINEEYAIALKTTSFEEFSKQVHSAICANSLGDLLLPDKEHVNSILLHHVTNKTGQLQTMLSSYFTHSETAFNICGLLLKGTHNARTSYDSVQCALDQVEGNPQNINEEQCHRISRAFASFTQKENPFLQAQFEDVCGSLQLLRQQLDSKYQNVEKKARFVSLANSLFPGLRKKRAQIDAAAKGCFVLKNHLETTRMLVARVYDEVEQSKSMIRICEREQYEIYPVQEVVKVLMKNDSMYRHRLDEIGEQACLCLLNINRARSLLLQEIQFEQ